MAYFYGGLGQNPLNTAQQNAFIPLGRPQNAVPQVQGAAQLTPQAGKGFGTTSSFNAAPDLVRQNILQGAGNFADPTSSLYNAYKQHALQNYNAFEKQYGYGEVPYSLAQNPNYGASLFNPGTYGAGNVMSQLGVGAGKNTYALNTIDPYSGQLLKSQDFSNPYAMYGKNASAYDQKSWNDLNRYNWQQNLGGIQGGFDAFKDYLMKLGAYQRGL